ncbi:MAG: RAD55 family ATPase [Nanobdellota archaeon]
MGLLSRATAFLHSPEEKTEGHDDRQDKFSVTSKNARQYVKTGIGGFDKLIEKGIPRGSASLICGGPGSGKTIFCLQAAIRAAEAGETCLFMSFEERLDRLREHMRDFGWNPEKLEAQGKLILKRYDPYELTRSVEAMMEKAKGELMIDISPVIFPDGVNPDKVIVDSLSSVAAAFSQREDAYRTYIEQLFKLFEQMNVTSFFISELVETRLEQGGSAVEQFLADNVIIIYNIKKQNIRESAIEILKMRGTKFQKKIVAMQIVNGAGMVVYPEQRVYG